MSERRIVARAAAFVAAAVVALVVARAEDPPLRDPTRPYRAQAASGERGSAPHRPELSAVLVSPLRRVAVIDGKLYHVGERVDGALVTRIEPRAVYLRRGDEERVLRLASAHAETGTSQGDSTR